MAKWADPFYIFGTLIQVILVAWLLYLGWKGYKYLKMRKHFKISGDTKYWYQAVMLQDGPSRISQPQVDDIRKRMTDPETGEKRRVGKRARLAVVAAVIILAMGGAYATGMFDSVFAPEPPAPPIVAVIRIISYSYLSNLTVCQSGVIVTYVQGALIPSGQFVYLYADTRLNLTIYSTYEFTLEPSATCPDPNGDYYRVVQIRQVA